MIITDKAQIKIAELRESNNLRLSGSDELECYELIESDLKLPADATFTRSSIAYLSDGTQVDVNTPRFEQGKFGKAVMIEEGTTNLIPSNMLTFEGWTRYQGTSVTVTQNQPDPFGGTRATRIQTSGGTRETKYFYPIVSPSVDGQPYALSCWIKCLAGSVRISRNLPYMRQPIIYENDGWVKVELNGTGDGTSNFQFKFSPLQIADSLDILAYLPMAEAKPYSTSFTDGTRAVETLTIPTEGVLNPQEGTVEFWVKPLVLANWNNFFNMATSNGRFLLYFATDGRAKFDYGPSDTGPVAPAGTIQENNWYYIALRWSATTGKQALFINGVKYEKDLPNGVATSFLSTVSVVNNYSAYIDDLRISSIARSDEEILAAYQSGQPLPVDEWTTYKLDFDDKIRITTQGQIICNELIEI